ncbi:hypothetical protein [Mycolicibacterium palauense]|uniref:hypothetical protein n=1 Tax=Mycolicibacterium palauense TaxID=2034511 RepID=UPI000BFF1675|nr:hypothetical protein [Mycolicibacterium palauense]
MSINPTIGSGFRSGTARSTAAGCAALLALALSAPCEPTAAALAAQPTTNEVLAALMTGSDPDLGPAQPSTSSTGWLTGPPFDVPADTLVINTPGSDDTTLYTRIDPMRGDLRTAIVVYPEAVFPIISGKSGYLLPIFAPTYDQSVNIAVNHTIATMAGLKEASDRPYVVYTGYSQGADAVGESAARVYGHGLLDPTDTQIVLVSDPRSPWGIMQWAADHFPVGLVFSLVGAKPEGGARDPAATGDQLQVTSVLIDGDPIANFQWVWYRPVTSLVVDAAGFLAVHSIMGPQNYSNLDQIPDKETLYSADGNTTYLVYHAEHPLTQVTEMALGAFGIQLSDSQVDRLEEFNDWFYPLQQPSPERAAPGAPVLPTPPAPAPVADDTTAASAEAETPAARIPVEEPDAMDTSVSAATPEVATPADSEPPQADHTTPAGTDRPEPTLVATAADPTDEEAATEAARTAENTGRATATDPGRDADPVGSGPTGDDAGDVTARDDDSGPDDSTEPDSTEPDSTETDPTEADGRTAESTSGTTDSGRSADSPTGSPGEERAAQRRHGVTSARSGDAGGHADREPRRTVRQ